MKKNYEKYNNPPEKYHDELEGGKYFVHSENVFTEEFTVRRERVLLSKDFQLILKIINKYKLFIYDDLNYANVQELLEADRDHWNKYIKILKDEKLPLKGEWSDLEYLSVEGQGNTKKIVEEFDAKYQDQIDHIKKNRDHWINLMEPIIKYYRIPKDIRLDLYKRFKESTVRKLNDAINDISDMIPLFYQTQTYFDLYQKKELYERELVKLNRRSGEDVFIYYYLRLLYNDLSNRLKVTEQDQVVYILKNGTMDFKKNELNNIKSLRHRVLKNIK